MMSLVVVTKTAYLCVLICVCTLPKASANVAAFLERQRQLAEEQWNSNEEGLKYEDEEEEGGSLTASATGEASTDYAYVYVDENGDYYETDEDEDEAEEEVPVFIPKKKKKSKGYKKYAGRSLRKCDPYNLQDVILEVHGLVKCPIRNESAMMKMRDDHQLNLRVIKKEIQEKRSGQQPVSQVCVYGACVRVCFCSSIYHTEGDVQFNSILLHLHGDRLISVQ